MLLFASVLFCNLSKFTDDNISLFLHFKLFRGMLKYNDEYLRGGF